MKKQHFNQQTIVGLAWIIGLGTLGLSSGCANPNGCFGNTPTYGPYNGYAYPPAGAGTFQPPPNMGAPMIPNNGVPVGAPGTMTGGFNPGLAPQPGYYGQPTGNIPAPVFGR